MAKLARQRRSASSRFVSCGDRVAASWSAETGEVIDAVCAWEVSRPAVAQPARHNAPVSATAVNTKPTCCDSERVPFTPNPGLRLCVHIAWPQIALSIVHMPSIASSKADHLPIMWRAGRDVNSSHIAGTGSFPTRPQLRSMVRYMRQFYERRRHRPDSGDAEAGSSAGFNDGAQGSFRIAPTDKTGRDLGGKGLLQCVGKHHLRFVEPVPTDMGSAERVRR